jgi:glutathione S-transferase
MTYDLWYWDGIPGRGEFIRLALEAGGIPYRDRVREMDDGALVEDMGKVRPDPPFAPPYLVADGMTIAQTCNILAFLGERHGLAPDGEAGRFWVAQLNLTIADVVDEAHDVHHPISGGLYYEDQKPEALRRAEGFRAYRIPGYLGWFERALEARGTKWLAGERWTTADLSLFQLIEGLRHAFPRRMKTVESDIPRVVALHDAVAALPELQDYLSSDRRLAFGMGIFRAYPELDGG